MTQSLAANGAAEQVLTSPALVALVAGAAFVAGCWILAAGLSGPLRRMAKALEERNTLTDGEAAVKEAMPGIVAAIRKEGDGVHTDLMDHLERLDEEVKRVDSNTDKLAGATAVVAERVGIAGGSFWELTGGLEGRVDTDRVRLATGATGPQPVVPPPAQQGPARAQEQRPPGPPPPPRQGHDDPDQEARRALTGAILRGAPVEPRDQYPPLPFDPRDLRQTYSYAMSRLQQAGMPEMLWEQHPRHTGFTVWQAFHAALKRDFGLEQTRGISSDFETHFHELLHAIPEYQHWLERRRHPQQ